jgi:hypothetical protein
MLLAAMVGSLISTIRETDGKSWKPEELYSDDDDKEESDMCCLRIAGMAVGMCEATSTHSKPRRSSFAGILKVHRGNPSIV